MTAQGTQLPFDLPLRVYYEDTDAAGVVYYANYLRYFERGRTEMLYTIGLPLHELQKQGIVFPVHEVHVRYKAPARLGDWLVVRTARVALKRSTVTFEAEVLRQATRLVTSKIDCACIDTGGKLIRIPDFVRAAFEPLASASTPKGATIDD